MRYNPETERGITLEKINQQCWAAVESLGEPTAYAPAKVWSCGTGGWITTLQPVPAGRPCATIA